VHCRVLLARSARLHPGRSNYRAVWLSLFATSMGLMAFLPVLALYVEERFGIEEPGELAFWAGLIYGAGPFAAACLGPLWGALGDRIGKKRMAVRANVAIALTTALMPLAPTPMILLAMRVAQGAFAGYVAPAMALVTGQLPRYVHGRIIARLQVAMATGSFVGPYVGAEITHWFGRSALFWVASVLSALAALRLHLRATEVVPKPDAARRSFLRDFAGNTRSLLSSPVFACLLVLVIVLRLGQNMLEPLLALFVEHLGPQPWIASWSGTPQLALDRTIAIAFAVLAVGQWICTPWWGRKADRHGPLRCLAFLGLGLAVLQGAMALATTVDQFLLLRCGVACLMAGSLTLAYSAASKRVPDHQRTLSFALVQSCIQFGLALGPLLGAAVAATAGGADGFRRAFGAAALLCGLAACGMFVLRRVESRLAT
jgi:MFS transporter, DHA1 family, multidrug resistance protein